MAFSSRWFFVGQPAEIMTTGEQREISRSVILDVKEDRLVLNAALDPHRPLILQVGKQVEILFLRVRQPPFVLETRVLGIERPPQPRLFVPRDETNLEVLERRRFFRLATQGKCPARLLRAGSDHADLLPTETQNLSAGGALLIVRGPVLLEEPLELKMAIPTALSLTGQPTETVQVPAHAQIRRVLQYDPIKKLSYVGITFTRMRMGDEQHLQRYLFLAEGATKRR